MTPIIQQSHADVINEIGFFHFGKNTEDPIGSLKSCLLGTMADSNRKDLAHSLIALPEAFNVRNGYWNPTRKMDLSIAAQLVGISRELGSAFIVGLLEKVSADCLPFSSAYLIDGNNCVLLSRKMENDGSGIYQPCAANCDQPLCYRGLCLAALICMDADFKTHRVSDRHSQLLRKMERMGGSQQALLIPSHMMTYATEYVVKAWPSHLLTVLANSAVSQPSVMRIGNALVQIMSQQNSENIVYLRTFR